VRALASAVLFVLVSRGLHAQEERPPVGRRVVDTLTYPTLRFEPPEVQEKTLSNGVLVLYLEDRTLPLVDVYARFRGGYGLFEREHYAAATAVPALIRNAGTATLPPDSVDELVEFYALSTSFGTAGGSAFSSLNTLTENLEPGIRLWGEMLREPRFDSAQVEVWRGQTLESVRRRADDPGRLAFSEFNRIMFGDHPVGWEMEPSDLEPRDVTAEHLRWIHRRVFCPDNMILGVSGDVSWSRARELLEEMVADWEGCPEPLPDPPTPDLRREGALFLIPRELNQSTIVMAEPGGVRRSPDEAYFASRIANSILGASGFTSRLVERVRTEEGLAYSVSSLWTAPDESEGIVGAITRTRGEATLSAIRRILEVLEEMKREPPSRAEVRTAVDEIVNGFVFNFQDPGQVVSRRLFYLAEGLPRNWLERYLEGIQEVRPDDVHRVVSREVDPSRMTILVVGDTARFEAPLETLGFGPPRILEVDPATPLPPPASRP